MTDRLFDVVDLYDTPLGPTTPPLSATRRLTIRNRQALDRGRHPATGYALRLPPLSAEICGTCHHLRLYRYHARDYVKCAKHRLGETHSAASDVRVGWPACTGWTPDYDDTDTDAWERP